MNRSRHTIMLNAFHPAKEVDYPEFFAGRTDQLTRLVDSLHTIGSCPVIYGDRGLGKTSLAVQIQRIAVGSDELLYSLGLQDRALAEADQYLPFFVTCTDETGDFKGLVQQLINLTEDADFADVGEKQKAGRLVERTTSRKLTIKAFETESIKRYERAKSRESYKQLNQVEKLQHLIKILSDSYASPILFIVDEIDRLRSTRGLASLIKATSDEHAKFILVGIASNIARLLADHLSIERSLVPVHVPVMSDIELGEIVGKAEAYLQGNAIDIRFHPDATRRITTTAAGYPWFVHVIGQSVLMRTVADSRTVVEESDVVHAIQNIATNQFVQQFSDMYLNLVRNSRQQEYVLRTFAEWPEGDIPVAPVYRVLRTNLAISDPVTYKSRLASKEFGKIIVTPSGRNKAWVRFSSEMFKTYVRIRPSVFEGIDARVRTVAEREFQRPR